MKKALFTSILALLIATGTTVRAQENPSEYLGLPGDNLNLYAVMSLFQESETLEGFERKLNEQNSRVNNLDLNGDNFVDYIMVTDYVDGQDHNIVMSVALNSNERQDVGVFTVQKLRNGEVAIQLIGDEELYGRNYIIEPIYDDNGETPNPGYNGRKTNVTVVRTNYYEVAAWPMIRFIYRPDYVIWRSSWRWGYYPSYWQPWSPFYYHYYYGYYSNWYPEYYRHYRHWHQPRYTRYNTYYYTNVRVFSPTVSVRVKEGNYKTTYSRPESRRDGEALYQSTRTGTDVRSNRTSTTTNEGRKSVSTSSGERSTGSTTTRTNTRTNTINNTGTIRRSDNPTSVKSGTSGSSGQNAATTRRQSTSGSDRAATKPAATKSSGTVSRTRETTTKSSAPARTTTKSSAPSRSSTKATKSESSSRSTSTKAKEKESTSSSATKRR